MRCMNLAGTHRQQRLYSGLQHAVAVYMMSCHAVAAAPNLANLSAGLKGGFYAWYRVFDNKVGLLQILCFTDLPNV